MAKQTGRQWKDAVNRQTREARGHTTAPDTMPTMNRNMNDAFREMHRETYGEDHPAFRDSREEG